MGFKKYKKDPEAILDYVVNWSSWLDEDDIIVASSWSPEDGIDVIADTFGDTTAVVWLSGGTAGESYEVTNEIVTAEGRRDDRTILIQVVER